MDDGSNLRLTRLNIKNFNKDPVNLAFENILCKVVCKQRKEEKIILNNVSGTFYAGRLTAIIGPSGAGKTTLLKILAGNKKRNVTGKILVNGENRNLDKFQWQSSFVSQESSMLPSLTAKETLMVAANLKLANTTQEEKTQIIQEISDLLGLQKTMDTRVQQLSGGELKRLSIGVELVTNPPIIFFDEPTSGLDSVSSCQVISHLQGLARNGYTIVCVIHQPSSRLFNMFDDLLLVSNGKSLYGGSVNDLVKDFEAAGFSYPQHYNRADFALEVASGEIQGNLDLLMNKNIMRSQEITSSLSNTIEEVSSMGKTFSDIDTKNSPGSSYLAIPTNEQEEIEESNKLAFKKSKKNNYSVSQIQQFWILLKRSTLCTFRDIQLAQMRVATHFVVGLILGLIYYDIGNDAAKINSNASLMFFWIMFVFFSNAMPTILTFPQEAAVFQREHQNNWYSLSAYFFSKLMADLPLQIICPTLFTLTSYFMTSQPTDSFRVAMVWGTCLLFGIIAQTMGLVMGVIFTVQMGIFSLPALTIPMMIFSGFFLKFSEIPGYMKWISYISYFRYGFESLLLALYDYDRKPLDCSVAFCYFKPPTKFLEYMDIETNNYTKNILALVGFTLFLQISLYIALKFRIWKSQ